MSFDEGTIQKVWDKGKVVPGKDQNTLRKDDAQAWIRREDYGNRDSQYGWEINHITPESAGGGKELSNLRPLHWKNNVARQDESFATPMVTSMGDKNVEIE